MDLKEKLEKLNKIRIEIINLEGEQHKLEFRMNEGITDLDIQGIGHLLFGPDYNEPLREDEVNRLRTMLESLINDRMADLGRKLQQLHQQAQSLIANTEVKETRYF